MSENLTQLGLPELQRRYEDATRNYSPELLRKLETDPREAPDDSPQFAYAKQLRRALTPHLAGNGTWQRDGFHNSC